MLSCFFCLFICFCLLPFYCLFKSRCLGTGVLLKSIFSVCFYFLLVLAISHPKKIKDSRKPGRSADHNVSSIRQKSAAFPGPVHTITASSSQRPQSGDTTKLRNGKGDTEANFRSYMPSKRQGRVAMKGR